MNNYRICLFTVLIFLVFDLPLTAQNSAGNNFNTVLHDLPIDKIEYISYSPKSDQLFIASFEQWAIMDYQTGVQSMTKTIPDSRIGNFILLADETHVAALAQNIKTNLQTLYVFETQTGDVVFQSNTPAGITNTDMAAWPAKDLLVILNSAGELILFDWQKNNTVSRFKVSSGKKPAGLVVKGNYALLADELQKAHWVDLAEERLVTNFPAFSGYKGTPLALTPSGKRAYWVTAFPSPKDYVFSLKTMQLGDTEPEIIDSLIYTQPARRIETADEETLVSVSNARVKVYKNNRAFPRQNDAQEFTEPERFVLIPDKHILVAAYGQYPSADGIAYYDYGSAVKVKQFDAHENTPVVDFSPDGNMLLMIDGKNLVAFDVAAGGLTYYIKQSSFSHTAIPCLSNYFPVYSDPYTVDIRETNSFSPFRKLELPNSNFTRFSMDGRYYADGYSDTLYQTANGRPALLTDPKKMFRPDDPAMPQISSKHTGGKIVSTVYNAGGKNSFELKEPGYTFMEMNAFYRVGIDSSRNRIALYAKKDGNNTMAIFTYALKDGRRLQKTDLPYNSFDLTMRNLFFTPNPDVIGMIAHYKNHIIIELWNFKTGAKAANIFFPLYSPADYIIYTPDGRIDGSDAAIEKMIHVEKSGKKVALTDYLKPESYLLRNILFPKQ